MKHTEGMKHKESKEEQFLNIFLISTTLEVSKELKSKLPVFVLKALLK